MPPHTDFKAALLPLLLASVWSFFGCDSGGDPGSAVGDTAVRKDSAVSVDSGVSGRPDIENADVGSARDGDSKSGGHLDFLMSGVWEGTATIRAPNSGELLTRTARLSLAEEAGTLKGILAVREANGDGVAFEYAVEGWVDRVDDELDLDLTGRRCPYGTGESCTDGIQPENLPDGTILETDTIYTGGELRIDEFELDPEFDGTSPDLTPVLEQIRLTPQFDPGERFAPGGGFKPVKVDSGIGSADGDSGSGPPLPEGDSAWTGGLTNSTAVGDATATEIECRFSIRNTDGDLTLQRFACGQTQLRSRAASPETPPRVVPGSLSRIPELHVIHFLVEGPETFHLFIGRRYGDQYAGVAVRNPELSESNDGEKRVVDPHGYPVSRVSAAFTWTHE